MVGVLSRPAVACQTKYTDVPVIICWLLLVERREGDELLEALPSSGAWIRLPWMDKLLRVAW